MHVMSLSRACQMQGLVRCVGTVPLSQARLRLHTLYAGRVMHLHAWPRAECVDKSTLEMMCTSTALRNAPMQSAVWNVPLSQQCEPCRG
jgi:hypothetical protein